MATRMPRSFLAKLSGSCRNVIGSWPCRHVSGFTSQPGSNFSWKMRTGWLQQMIRPSPFRHRFPVHCCRCCLSTTTMPHDHRPNLEPPPMDPFKMAEEDLQHLFGDIRRELQTENEELKLISNYYFDGKGKAIRPAIVVLMARAINLHKTGTASLRSSQRIVAMIVEMMHTATLVHDDVIDASHMRRGKPSINLLCGQRKAIFAGDFIVSSTANLLGRLRDDDAAYYLLKILYDLVIGELMQLDGQQNSSQRFKDYLEKTYNKTASLIANSCKAVAILSGANDSIQELSFQYGRNIGIAFQLVDDMLDFVSNAEMLGKPAAADMRLGLATAPVLFACEEFPELEKLISRKFSQSGDVEWALEAVMKSNGLQRTRYLAEQHCQAAVGFVQQLTPSPEQEALDTLADVVLKRLK